MTVLAIIVALGLAFFAFKFVTGLIKLGVLALIAVGIIWFFASGVAH